MDLVTVQAMDCFDKLNSLEKRFFIEAILGEMVLSDPDLTTRMMQKAMEIFKSPIPNLADKDYLTKTDAYDQAYEFMKEEDKPNATPSVSCNGKYLPGEVPTKELIFNCVKNQLEVRI